MAWPARDTRHERVRPPCERAEAREQLAERERLHEVVVRPGVEPADAIGDGVPSGEHEHRRGNAPSTREGAEVKPRPAWQQDVEHDHVVRREEQALACFIERAGAHALDAGVAQPPRDGVAQVLVILHQQHAHVTHLAPVCAMYAAASGNTTQPGHLWRACDERLNAWGHRPGTWTDPCA
jgi:hypothetical protein